MSKIMKAYELIGDEGQFRTVGGRTVYEAVMYNDSMARTNKVRLARLDGMCHQVNRYVEWDDPIEVLANYTREWVLS